MRPPSWFRLRTYKHFDVPVTANWALGITPALVATHAWSPLLHWTKSTPRYKSDQGKTVAKERPIMHASHRDACILAKYSAALTEKLDAKIKEHGLDDAVIAYRALGKSNYHFAETAQRYLAQHDDVEAMCFDVTGFFDNIDHARLKSKLKALLNVTELAPDWYTVFRAATRYSHVRKSDLKAHPVFSERMKHRAVKGPIATVRELKAAGVAVHINDTGIGVPQGTPISAALSNLYLFEFDIKIKALAERFGALYQRYSDDILLMCDPRHADELARVVQAGLVEELLQLQHEKTVRQVFHGPSDRSFQYLGFLLGRDEALVRPSSLSRQWRALKRAMRRSKALAQKLANEGRAGEIFTSKVRRRFTQVGGRNFLAYSDRSSDTLGSEKMREQVRGLRRFAARELGRVKAFRGGSDQ